MGVIKRALILLVPAFVFLPATLLFGLNSVDSVGDGFDGSGQPNSADSLEAYVPTGNGWWEIGPGSASGGGISNNAGRSSSPSLAIAPDGTPVIAWFDNNGGNDEIYVRRWNGSAWVEVGDGSASGGGISNNDGYSTNPSLAIDPDGMPIVAWVDNSSGDTEIFVRRWNGSAWVEMGAGSASSGGISNNPGESWGPSLAIAPDGTKVIAWHDNTEGDNEIYVLRWNGSAWVEVGTGSASGGGISNNLGNSFGTSLAIDLAGMPVIAWIDNSGGDPEIYIRRWDGSAWVEMGAGSASGGGISNNPGESRDPSLAIAPDGMPIVAWNGGRGRESEIYVRRWNGSAWVEMGAGSATGGGISNNDGHTSDPSLAIGPDGTPIVAWERVAGPIYVRHWNDSTWGELGAGSASGGGINNAQGSSTILSLDIAPDGTPVVAWSTSNEIHALKYVDNRFFAPMIHGLMCFNRPNEHEPNNGRSAANGPLCGPGAYRGLPNDSNDYFSFDSSGGQISIVMTGHVGEGLQLSLLREGVTNPVVRDYDPAGGWRLDYQGTAGRYYVRIYAATPKPGSAQEYTLQVTFTAGN